MACLVTKREKDQRTEYDQLNDIADNHDGAFSPFSVNKRRGSGTRRQTWPSCLALRIGFKSLAAGSGLTQFSGARVRICTSSALIRLSSNQIIRFEKISPVGRGKIWFSAVSRSFTRQKDKNSTRRLSPIVMMSPVRLGRHKVSACSTRIPGTGRRATITPFPSAGSSVLFIMLPTASQKVSHFW